LTRAKNFDKAQKIGGLLWNAIRGAASPPGHVPVKAARLARRALIVFGLVGSSVRPPIFAARQPSAQLRSGASGALFRTERASAISNIRWMTRSHAPIDVSRISPNRRKSASWS